jgi:hypothetical protein
LQKLLKYNRCAVGRPRGSLDEAPFVKTDEVALFILALFSFLPHGWRTPDAGERSKTRRGSHRRPAMFIRGERWRIET